MELARDAVVLGRDGSEAGAVDRIVIDPRSGEVTHVVVRGGMLFSDSHVVPVTLITETEESQVKLSITAEAVADLLPFHEQHYVALDSDELERRGFGPGRPTTMYFNRPSGGGFEEMPPMEEMLAGVGVENVPSHTVALEKGATVVGADGREIGSLAEILTAEDGAEVTHFVVSEGVLRERRRLIPTNWVEHVEEDRVVLAVGSQLVELRLHDYEGQPRGD